MSPVGTPDAATPELQLIREWREPLSARRILLAGGGSISIHVVSLVVFTLLMRIPIEPPAPVAPDLRRSVHLVVPRDLILTQQAPNQGKVSKDLDVRSAVHAPAPQAPATRRPSPPPGPVSASANAPAPVPESPKITTPPTPPKIEFPQIQAGVGNTQQAGNGSQAIPALAPPKEKPKLAFESVGGYSGPVTPNPNPRIPLPRTSVQDAARTANQSGGGGMVVGDADDPLESLPSLNESPAPGRIGSNLQLLSDPAGVDFKPYLIQVLTAVRRNWLAVIPQSARMGRTGRVLIQFIIDRTGGVPKLVIATPSGTEAFDRAAVASISASYPFPPLPADFKGDQIRLQLAFAYNTPTR